MLALQTIDSRELHPVEPVVITVGKFIGGTKSNIIPDKVELGLTVRTTSPETRKQVLASIERICRGLGIAAGPVSYTHLDVYKRQSWCWSIKPPCKTS